MKETIKTLINKIKSTTSEIKKEKQQELEEIEKKELESLKDKVKKIGARKRKKYNLKFLFKAGLVLSAVAYLDYLFIKNLQLVYMIVTAFIISMSIESMIQFFAQKMRRTMAIFLSYFIIGTFLIIGFVFIIPFVIDQSIDILSVMVKYFKEIQTALQNKGIEQIIQESNHLPAYSKDFIIKSIQNQETLNAIQRFLQRNISNLLTFSSDYIGNAGSIAFNTLTKFLGGIVKTLTIFVLAIFFSIDKRSTVIFLGRLWGKEEMIRIKLKKLYKKLGFWLQSNFIRSIYIWVTLSICLFTLSMFGIDIPHKGSLILMAGIAEFFPIVGPVIGAIPALLVGLTSYGLVGIIIIGLIYGLIQWTENTILMPLIMNQALGSSPLLIFLAIFAGGSILGPLGIILSIPIAVIVSFIFQEANGNNQEDKNED